MYKLICFLLVLLLFFSCKSINTGPEGVLKVSTDKDIYQIDEGIVVYIENETDSSAYFWTCNYMIGFYVEQKEDSVWVDCIGIGIGCLAIYPSGIREFTPGRKDTTEFSLWESGTYRIDVHYNLEQTEYVLPYSLYSNEFIVQ